MQGSRKRCGRWPRGSSADGAARHRNGALANRSSTGFWLGYVHATGILVRHWRWRACAKKGSEEETLCGWLIEGWLWHVAKGRAERLFQALQDRPVKALRLSDVGDLER